MDDLIGKIISHYRIIEEVGRGGMGVVYKAHDMKLDREVALKFLPQHLTASETEKARFLQEAKAASALNHPNVCTVHDIREQDGQTFIVMEYVAGLTLREIIRSAKEPLTIREVKALALQIADALCAAEKKGIVHRDIKSENIMITENRQVKVMDFGLAKFGGSMKLTRTSSTVGTLAYMSPEQIQGNEATVRSDIFSFGVVLFEMLTGRLPFRGEHEAAIMYSIVNEPPEPVEKYRESAPEELLRMVAKALEKDPQQRYSGFEDLKSDFRTISGAVQHPAVGKTGSSGSIFSTRHSLRKRLVRAVSIIMVCGIILTLIYFLLLRRETGPEQAIDSIAVLPFRNASGDPNTEYLSDGITEHIINALSRLQTLRVIPRSTSFHYKGKEDDAQRIGNELKVRVVLSGRVIQRGNDLNIQVELTDIGRVAQLWGDQFTGNISELLTLQDELERAIATQLRVSGDQTQKLVKRSTENTEAYQLYLKGRYYWDKRSVAGFNRALQYFQQALDIDPNYALAYTGVADCYDLLGLGIYNGLPPAESYPKAKAAIEKAFQLDSTLGEAYTTRAHINHSFEYDWPKAERDFRRAIELSPRYGSAHVFFGVYLNAMGRTEEAGQQFEIAQQVEPLSLPINTWLGMSYYYRREYDRSIEQLRKSIDIDASFGNAHYMMAWPYVAKGKFEEAIAEMRLARKLSGDNPVAVAGLVYGLARGGHRSEAQALMDTLRSTSRGKFVSPHNLAIASLGLGETEAFFQYLDQAVNQHSFIVSVGVLRVDPVFDPVHKDPRFIAIMKKAGLP